LYAGKFDYVVSDIPDLYDYLAGHKIENSWGVFASVDLPKDAISTFNIQFSVEAGEVGLDWGLNAPENRRVLDAFLSAAKKEGIEFQFIEAANGFQYYRSTDERVRMFPVKFLIEFYGFSLDERLHYISGGF
jgi:ABC-type amino acid transport substrate-binding protein